MTKNFTVSVHIPKTAGTTVADVFSRVYQRRVIFDYEGYSNPIKASDLVKDSSNFISKYFKVMHGHFYASKYFDVFPSAFYISTLRHPVNRVISQFMHEYNEKSKDALFHESIQNGNLGIVEFAEQPGIGNAMSLHLSGRAIADYDLLLISERLLESLAVYSVSINNLFLETNFGYPVKIPVLNVGKSRATRIEFDDKTRAEIFNRTKEDNELYAEACSILDSKIKKYLR